ncbi:MAG: hypothetical protein HY327_13050 [Chloroflexi bacterium]|nr:hypothetical protein [Chloroflexota bacterium]
MKFKVMLISVFIAITLFVLPVLALAHGTAEISVTPDVVAAGGKIKVKGQEMGANEEFTILLEGLKFKTELGEAKSNDKEEFQVEFVILVNAPSGVYQVRAVGKDGDTTTAELTVTAPLKAAVTSQPTAEPTPSAAPMKIAINRPPIEMYGALGIVILSVVAGLALVRWN